MMMSEFMLGRDVDDDEIGTLTVFPIDATATIEFRSQELEALCPAVAHTQPDIYDMTIRFTADHSIESKSLKLWLVTYRDQRIFAEHLTVDIATTIERALLDAGAVTSPVSVSLVQNIRGGLVETVRHTTGGTE
jgi:7-cyano-7-deazaguanine reductase